MRFRVIRASWVRAVRRKVSKFPELIGGNNLTFTIAFKWLKTLLLNNWNGAQRWNDWNIGTFGP